MFATLDPTFRRLSLPSGASTVVADTVGFVSRLPHDLIAAFEATLEESRLAQLLLHVVDASDPEHAEKVEQVMEVLERIGAHQVPWLEVYNKVDRLALAPRVDVDETGVPVRVWVSAVSGAGIDLLRQAIAHRLQGNAIVMQVMVPWHHAPVRAALYQSVDVLSEDVYEGRGWRLHVQATRSHIERIIADDGHDAGQVDGVQVALASA